uniref:tryptophan 7-halogenase n=1 Tax=Ningiella ruwaisensis TaxID=2364274 RepID=UPI0010A036AB
MKVGKLEKTWNKNVIALGLSQGFIEPLEATALHLVLETMIGFFTHFKQGDFSQKDIEHFNQSISARYEGIRDYIVCHYKVNTRNDTEYWHDVKSNIPISDNLCAVLDTWDAGKDITPVLQARGMDKYYPAVSWYCLLAGYGRFKNKPGTVDYDQKISEQISEQRKQVRRFLQATKGRFLSHQDALKALS